MDPELTTLADAIDQSRFGGKAASLAAAIRAGLPVPDGLAIGVDLVERVAAGDAAALATAHSAAVLQGGRVAVRSSAVGEDSAGASFAGQHASKLNVEREQIVSAVREVWLSGRTASARAYRARRGVAGEPRVAVVLQAMVEPAVAGVMFTRNPVTGADERVIEAAWGLGEVVVNGAVIPDRVRMDGCGRVLEVVAGEKHVQMAFGPDGGTEEQPVEAARQTALCVAADDLGALHELSERCRRLWGPDLDIEWAIAHDGRVYLLQCRPITTLASRPR